MNGTNGAARRPVAALDVDGVVVLEDAQVPVNRQTVSAHGRWRREVWVPEHAEEKLAELDALFDCVWVTAWSHNAPAALSLLGGPLGPAASWPWLGVQFHKLAAIRLFADGRPWIWIDDAIDDLGAVPDPTDGLLVRVDSRRGIADVEPQELLARLSMKQVPLSDPTATRG